MRFVVAFFGASLALPAAVVWYFTRRTARDERQATFAGGGVPALLPEGPYRGSVPGYERLAAKWAGKRFAAASATGVNLVHTGAGDQLKEAAPFRTYRDASVLDRAQEVLRVDYNVPGNPFWLRICTDELVEQAPGHLLGKALIRLVPGHPFAMLFFELHAMAVPDRGLSPERVANSI